MLFPSTGRRKLAAIFIVLAMLCSAAAVPAAAGTAEDIVDHWAQERIQSWLDQGYASGYPDGTFRPEEKVSRAEFVTFMNGAFEISEAQQPPDFVDVQEGDWFYSPVADAVEEGLLSGYPDNTFRPNNPITREEAAVIVNHLLELEDRGLADEFADQSDISGWAREAVAAVAAAELMSGYPDDTFRPEESITRAETVSTLDRSLELEDPVETLTATVENEEELTAALADEEVQHITFAADIEANITAERPLTVDFAEYSLKGDVKFEHTDESTSELIGTADPSIEGDLRVDTPYASFINNAKVSGEIKIDAVEPGSWNENTDGNSLVINAAGVTVNLAGSPAGLSVTSSAADIIIAVETGVEVEIEIHSEARNVTVDASTGANVTVSGEGAEDVTVIGEGAEDVFIKAVEEEFEQLHASLVEMNGSVDEINVVQGYLEDYYYIEKYFEADQDDLNYEAEGNIRVGENAYQDLLHITADGDDGDDIARLVTADGEKLDPFQTDWNLLANFVFLNVDYAAAGDYFDGTSTPNTYTIYDFFGAYYLFATPNAVFGWEGEISDEAKEAFAERFYYWALEQGESVYISAQEAEGEIENQYPDLPDWDIHYANGYTAGDVFLKPTMEEYGARVDYLDSYCAETGDNVVYPPSAIEAEVMGSYKDPETGEEREILEEDLHDYSVSLLRSNGELAYRFGRDHIHLQPEDGYTEFLLEPIPTEELLRGDHYEVRFEMSCDQGVTRESTTQVVAYEETFDLTVCAGTGGIVTADILPEGNMIEECTTIMDIGEDFAVELEAHPEAGMEFQEWQGDAEGEDPVISIPIDSHKEVKASFTIALEDLSIPEPDQTLEIEEGEAFGEEFQFTAVAQYADGSQEEVTQEAQWASSNSEVASVEAGLVTARSEGTAMIESEVGREEAAASVKVELVDSSVEELYIPEGSQTLQIGDDFQFTAVARYADGSEEEVTQEAQWASSDNEVATVGDGLLHALDEGSTTIWADYKGEEAAVSVTVERYGLWEDS